MTQATVRKLWPRLRNLFLYKDLSKLISLKLMLLQTPHLTLSPQSMSSSSLKKHLDVHQMVFVRDKYEKKLFPILFIILWLQFHEEFLLYLQALNNLGSVYVDCGKLDLAADCYKNALTIKHTRAHQGLARVYHLKSQRKDAYNEMTKLIEKAQNNASAFEKRSEYCDREVAQRDLVMATQLDPLRTYPYRYRAAGVLSFTAISCFLLLFFLEN